MSLFRRLWRLLCHPRQLKKQARFVTQYLWFWLRYPFLRVAMPPLQPEKTVLFVSLSDWFPRLKMEGILAKSLQMRGYTPVILTLSACKWARLYFRLFGIDRLMYYDELLHANSLQEDEEEADAFLAKNPAFHEILALREGEVDFGKRVLSTIVKTLCAGSIEFGDPEVMRLMRAALIESRRAARVARKVFDTIHPSAVFVIDRAYTPHGEFVDCAVERKINTIVYGHGQRQDALILKRYTDAPMSKDMEPFSVSLKSWEYAKKMPWSSAHEQKIIDELTRGYTEGTWYHRQLMLAGRKTIPPDALRKMLRLDPRKKTAVIFSHVLWDGSVCFGTNLFDDYEQWLIETLKVAMQNPNVNWILKLHPDYRWRTQKMDTERERQPLDLKAIQKHLGKVPDNIVIVPQDTEINTYSFFPVIDYCVTVRGTVGIECACFGIPVITAGTGRYAGYCFTEDSASQDGYREKLRHIQDIPALDDQRRSLARRYAYVLFLLKPLPFTAWEMMPVKLWGGGMDHDVIIRARSLKGLQEAQDLRTFAGWVMDSEDEDYLDV